MSSSPYNTSHFQLPSSHPLHLITGTSAMYQEGEGMVDIQVVPPDTPPQLATPQLGIIIYPGKQHPYSPNSSSSCPSPPYSDADSTHLSSPTVYPIDSNLLYPNHMHSPTLSPITSSMDEISLRDNASSQSVPGTASDTYGVPQSWGSSQTDTRTEIDRGRRQFHSAPASRTHSCPNTRPSEIHSPCSSHHSQHISTTEYSSEADFMAAFLNEDLYSDGGAQGYERALVDESTFAHDDLELVIRNFQPDTVLPTPALSDDSHQPVSPQGDFSGEPNSPYLSSSDPQYGLLLLDNASESQILQQQSYSGMGRLGEPISPNEAYVSPSTSNMRGFDFFSHRDQNEDHSSSSPSSSVHSYRSHFGNANDSCSPSPSISSLQGFGEPLNHVEATYSTPSRGRQHRRSVSGSPSSTTSRTYSPYQRPNEITGVPSSPVKVTDKFLTVPGHGARHRRSYSDAGGRALDGGFLSRRKSDPTASRYPIPPGLAAQPTRYEGCSTPAGTSQNPPNHQLGVQAQVVKHKVASDAIVTASKGRRMKEARFTCLVPGCNATFTANHNLKNHLNSHSGIKDFKCESCGAQFTTAGVLARHTKNTHPS